LTAGNSVSTHKPSATTIRHKRKDDLLSMGEMEEVIGVGRRKSVAIADEEEAKYRK
jgi:predicted transcriptional regulator